MLRRIGPILTIHAVLGLYKAMVQSAMTNCSTAFLFMSETNRKKFERLEKRAAKINFWGAISARKSYISLVSKYTENSVCLFCAQMLQQNCYLCFSATRANGRSLKTPRIKAEIVKRGFYYCGFDIYKSLPTHQKTVKFYLPFKKKNKRKFYGLIF